MSNPEEINNEFDSSQETEAEVIPAKRKEGNMTIWALAGGGCFFALNIITEGAVPGGAVGGAIGGAIGAVLCMIVDKIRN
ncbi:MAG: hypothetical protein KKF30_00615 [Proteobacteria bacterium]|nr:hypothetical protein [Pseudomonadota bacterium]MBU4471612.1 hypothetical protein [Pseudomonadota bacterium]MCG2751094.1 hypothetical protein [Desulfobacteraceae bacterium]